MPGVSPPACPRPVLSTRVSSLGLLSSGASLMGREMQVRAHQPPPLPEGVETPAWMGQEETRGSRDSGSVGLLSLALNTVFWTSTPMSSRLDVWGRGEGPRLTATFRSCASFMSGRGAGAQSALVETPALLLETPHSPTPLDLSNCPCHLVSVSETVMI